MKRWTGWRRRWQAVEGLGDIVGGIGGLLLLVFILTGSISAFRLWQTHQVLDRATVAALRSEEQQGCWTASTSRAVSAILQQGGLAPNGVHITTYTATPSPYGTSIAVGFNYSLHTDFLFGKLALWTEHAGASGSSFYVPTTSGSVSACATPHLGTVASGAGTSGTPTMSPNLTLFVAHNHLLTGQSETVTVTSNVLSGAEPLSIVDTTTGHVVQSCTNTTTCTATISQVTQNSAISRTYQGVLDSPVGMSNAVKSSSQTVTWSPVAHITINRWWVTPTNVDLPTSGMALPNNGDNTIWWSYSVSSSTESYQGWSQAWDTPFVGGAYFASNDTMGWLAPSLSPGTHHIFLTFFFAHGAVQTVESPPITVVNPVVTFNATKTTPVVGQSTTLTATSNFSLSHTDYAVNIEDTTTGKVIKTCTSGTTCSVSPLHNTPQTLTYQADIGPSGATIKHSGVIAQSSSASVSWQTLVYGAPTIPIFTHGTTLASGWSATSPAISYAAGTQGGPKALGGWINGQNSVTYTFRVISGTPTIGYGLAQGAYQNNAPVHIQLNGTSVATITSDVGPDGSTMSSNAVLWSRTLSPGVYRLTLSGSMFNIYGLWTNDPQGIQPGN